MNTKIEILSNEINLLQSTKYLIITFLFLLINSCQKQHISVNLTTEEKEFLGKHKNDLRVVADPSYAPIEFIDKDGVYKGAATDYMELIQNKLNIKVKRIFCNSWEELIRFVKEGKTDIVQTINPTEERKNYLLFTQSFIEVNNVILMKKGRKGDVTLDELNGKKVGYVKNYSIEEYIKLNHPNILLEPFPDILSALRSLAFNHCDAVVTDLIVALYYIEEEGITNLKVAGTTDYPYTFSIGVRKDMPLLRNILDKALKSISNEQKKAINNKWFIYQGEVFSISNTNWFIIIGVFSSIFLIIVLMIYWNKILRKRIIERTKELENYKNELEEKIHNRTAELLIKNEEIIEKNRRLEVLNSTKDRFFSIISHDLKNPFFTLLGYTEFLEKEYNLMNEQERIGYIKHLNKNLKKVYELVNNLLQWSLTQTNGLRIKKEYFEINEIIENIISLLNYSAEQKRIKINMNIKQNTKIFADKNTIITILRNIIGNAIKYSYKDSEINLYSKEDEDYILLEIQDSGIGISQELKNELYKLDIIKKSKGTDSEEGTGLGLIICKEFIEKNDGVIWYESEEGEGTSFFVKIPKVNKKSEYTYNVKPK